MTAATTYEVKITDAEAGDRLDRALTSLMALAAADEVFSRARIQQLIEGGNVTLDCAPVTKPKTPVKEGETYIIAPPPPVAATPVAQEIALDIIYEDADLLVINKPAGMVVHPAAGNHDNTLVNALLAHCGDSLSGIGGVRRPGIVHRLDKETSGLMVVAKNDTAHNALAAQFASHDDGSRELSRTYVAIVHGLTPADLTIETQMGRDPNHRQRMAVLEQGGKHAITHMERISAFGTKASLVRCQLETGRTHQIRVHMHHVGYPVVGDPLYGKKRGFTSMLDAVRYFPRQALHAAELSFKHPRTGKKVKFSSDLPADMQALITALQKG